MLAGAAGPTAIARWAKFKEDLLTEMLDLPNGVPSKDVFRRVLMLLKPEAFQACFNAWLRSLRDEADGRDRRSSGRSSRSTARRCDAATTPGTAWGALHAVTVWASEYGLSLGQQACDEKSNEITAIPELLGKIDIRGGIVTIDAMGTQKEIAEEVVDGEADYVLALKGNHETLHREVIEHIEEQFEGDLEEARS